MMVKLDSTALGTALCGSVIYSVLGVASKEQYLIDWGLAYNEKTPRDVFLRLIERKGDFTHRTTLDILHRNKALPADLLVRVKEEREKLQ